MSELKKIEEIYPMGDYEAYQIAIENLAKTKSSHVFKNAGPIHAAIVIGNILKTAQQSVKIFSGNFKGDVSNNLYYIHSLREYLTRKKPLEVIFETEPNRDSLALEVIKKHCGNYVDHHISLRKLRTDLTSPSYDHFALADGRMFRIETAKEDYHAICSFNHPEVVSLFEAKFKTLSNLSDPYQY